MTLEQENAEQMAELFRALGDVTRLKLIAMLVDGEKCVHELTEALDVSQSAVSHQLRGLHKQRLVRKRKQGRHVYYQLDDGHVRDLFERGLEHVRHEHDA